MRVSDGSTLLEMLITVAIAAIVLGTAIPAFDALVLDSRRTGSVNGLVTALHLARSEAIKRGREAVLCPIDNNGDCAAEAAPWDAGWVVFINTDRDHPPAIDEDEAVILHRAPVEGAHIRANRPAFVYRPFGRNATNGTITFCDSRGASAARAVIVSPTGRPRTAATTASGTVISCNPQGGG